ncbi:hypothetical protein Bpfe_025540 [Biomphalaria pfeifferi]|uniref:Uncharacterized protein n=1 Tax=Biomphalaria pfeifferi TaxID=112525 RepID=A0AAD8AZ94_BIOPF|nr:hypothetical protein Bpfe_025540 [Biomphalaria pfeifferi]
MRKDLTSFILDLKKAGKKSVGGNQNSQVYTVIPERINRRKALKGLLRSCPLLIVCQGYSCMSFRLNAPVKMKNSTGTEERLVPANYETIAWRDRHLQKVL